MPTGGALFGSSSGPGSTGGVKHLVEFRAGRMNLKGRMVYPDKRKGLLYIYQSEDSLMHFCWQDRHTGTVEDDLIIFPNDCEYVRVPQCTTGRAYVLKFKPSSRNLFFWMQEPRTDRDEEYCKRINEYLNNPPGIPSGNNPDQDLQSLLNNMSQSQLMQFFGGIGQMGGLSSLLGTISRPNSSGRTSATSTPPAITHRPSSSTTTTTTATTTTTTATANSGSTNSNSSGNAPIPLQAPATETSTNESSNLRFTGPGGQIQLSDLQTYLQGISTPEQNIDLSTCMTAETLTTLLNNGEAISRLQEHLPVVEDNKREQLWATLASPQFQQALSQFSSALQSGQLGPVVSQLAVHPEAVAAASQGNMLQFFQALENNASATAVANSATPEGDTKDDQPKEEAKKEEPKTAKKDDEDMQLD